MKIALITPGFGDQFYCQNCLRDELGIKALKSRGVDVVGVPVYLPLLQKRKKREPLFFPAVRVYLDSMFPNLSWLSRLTAPLADHPGLLSFIARHASTTSAKGLGALTIAMLKGTDPYWLSYLEPMVGWMERVFKPDVIHLSNALLLGFAPALKRRLHCKIICTLQDETLWFQDLRPNEQQEARRHLQESARAVDLFIPVSNEYRKRLSKTLSFHVKKFTVINPGVPNGPPVLPRNPNTIGFLARLCADQGLDLLVEAFLALAGQAPFHHLRLRLTGGHSSADTSFIKGLQNRSKGKPGFERIEWAPDLYRDHNHSFFSGLSLLVQPTRVWEAFSAPAAEAMGRGIPCLLPKRGGGPEMIRTVAGGLVYPTSQETTQEIKTLSTYISRMLLSEQPTWLSGKPLAAKSRRVFSLKTYAQKTRHAYRLVMV